MQNKIDSLDSLISQFDLNKHPFYQEWRAGTLPKSSLCRYAGEYAHFVGTIADGWETVGEPGYAAEERIHEELWADFSHELQAHKGQPSDQTAILVDSARTLFARGIPEALGALYAFEAQQPNTSRSKLDGLNEHYQLSDRAKKYFEVHADDVHEAQSIRESIDKLSDSEFLRARNACALLCTAMVGALDGIYYTAAAAA